MKLEEAINELTNKYARFGFTSSDFKEMLIDGVMNHGFSVRVAFNGIRMIIGDEYHTDELFSVEDVAECAGVTPQEVMEEIEKKEKRSAITGEDTSQYWKKGTRYYFPNGLK